MALSGADRAHLTQLLPFRRKRIELRLVHIHPTNRNTEKSMSKGMDSKKSEKKKPAKTMKEKRAAKQEKKKEK